MTLARSYVGSSINQVNDSSFVLSITFSWYGIWEFVETYTFSTLEEAKKKLILERTGLVGYLGQDGTFIPL